jgi:hypothetical protein
MKPAPKPKKPKPIPLLKDKKAMEEIKADPKQVLSFFQNCIKKPSPPIVSGMGGVMQG